MQMKAGKCKTVNGLIISSGGSKPTHLHVICILLSSYEHTVDNLRRSTLKLLSFDPVTINFYGIVAMLSF